MVTVTNGIRNSRPLFFWSIDRPSVPLRHKFHLAPRSPPAIDFSRQCHPDLLPGDYLSQVIEQRFVDLASALTNQIVRMRSETHQSILLPDESELFLPQIKRLIVQNVKYRIILGRS